MRVRRYVRRGTQDGARMICFSCLSSVEVAATVEAPAEVGPRAMPAVTPVATGPAAFGRPVCSVCWRPGVYVCRPSSACRCASHSSRVCRGAVYAKMLRLEGGGRNGCFCRFPDMMVLPGADFPMFSRRVAGFTQRSIEGKGGTASLPVQWGVGAV